MAVDSVKELVASLEAVQRSAHTGLHNLAEVMRMAKVRVPRVDRLHKGLSRLPSADSTTYDKPGERIGGYELWK
jgi:hypothetical protein